MKCLIPLAHVIREDPRGDPEKKDWYSFAGITLSLNLTTTLRVAITKFYFEYP